jgi:hypothetical protein
MKRPAFAITPIRLGAWLLAAFATFLCALAQAAPQAGWWWNPTESGRGFFLEVQGSRMFMSGYFYAEDGKPTWLVSNDPMPDANAYDGHLLAFRDGQSLLGDYHHPSGPQDAGLVSLRFTDETHGSLTWAGGSVPIERYDFHHGAAAGFQPRTGWWWNPDESGRGFSIEMQGDHMFIGAYMYDDAGRPVWYVADALMQSPTRFSAPLLQFANGQTMGGAYHAPTPPAFAGTITVDFSAPDQATVTLSDDGAHAAAKRGKTIIIMPQYVLRPVVPAKAAALWVGGFVHHRTSILAPVVNNADVEVLSMTWTQDMAGLDGGYPAFYKIASGFAVVSVEQTAPFCTISAATSVDLGEGDLAVQADGSYSGTVTLNYTLPADETCVFPEGTIVIHHDFPGTFVFHFSGSLQGGAMKGVVNDPPIALTSFSGSWSFEPRF